ncbi:MAG: hypothetical protein AW07_04174 [Candidatus Accumulibacter sp. SK-11]|nr:MAG: hypothetical protein AW07_04174 [Candidatus Accumulibacter sp. SK-11]
MLSTATISDPLPPGACVTEAISLSRIVKLSVAPLPMSPCQLLVSPFQVAGVPRFAAGAVVSRAPVTSWT